jgi:tetratricopeptide (TPR) repeat protein
MLVELMDDKGNGAPGARLRSEFDRLKSADPFQVLGLAPSADLPAIRWAFLELTKRYHPNRFARETAPVRDVANELFLVIRRAYEVLSDEQKRRTWRERIGSGSTGPQTQPKAIVVPVSAVDPVPAIATPQSAPVVPPLTPRPTPPPAPLDPTEKRRLFEEANRFAEQGNWAEARRIYDRLSRGTMPPISSSPPPLAAPSKRPSTPPLGLPRVPTAALPPPPLAAPPAAAPVSFKPRATGTPGQVGTPGGVRPGTDVNAVLEQAKNRTLRFDEAHKLFVQGDYQAAREAFHKIAAEDPQTKKYRVYLSYAWGLEHRAAGRLDEAIKELERAVGLEPSHADIRKDLERTREMKKGGGLFSKLFGR